MFVKAMHQAAVFFRMVHNYHVAYKQKTLTLTLRMKDIPQFEKWDPFFILRFLQIEFTFLNNDLKSADKN